MSYPSFLPSLAVGVPKSKPVLSQPPKKKKKKRFNIMCRWGSFSPRVEFIPTKAMEKFFRGLTITKEWKTSGRKKGRRWGVGKARTSYGGGEVVRGSLLSLFGNLKFAAAQRVSYLWSRGWTFNGCGVKWGTC